MSENFLFSALISLATGFITHAVLRFRFCWIIKTIIERMNEVRDAAMADVEAGRGALYQRVLQKQAG